MWGEIDTANDARCREVRRCAKCSAPSVTVFHVTQHYSRGLPTGRSYSHRCGSCRATFDSISTWRAMTQYMFAGVLTVFGFSLVAYFFSALFELGFALFQQADGRMWGTWAFGALMFVLGLGWAAWTTWLVGRLMLLHPVAGSR